MMRQYLAIKRAHPDAIVFYRMGDFYEMFLEDAVTAAGVLKIALTTRDKGKENSVPMCGVPYHAAEGYLAKLVSAGHKVAICEQTEDPALAKGLVRREVVRVVTPGTAVEPALLDAREPSYLAAVLSGRQGVGLALVDASTGDFRAVQWEGSEAERQLLSALAQFSPRELLLPEGETIPPEGPWHVSRSEAWRFATESAREELLRLFGVATLAGFGLEDKVLATGAAGAAAAYLRDVHRRGLSHLTCIRVMETGDGLVLDQNALRNLEVVQSQAGDREGTLLALLDRTVTAQGARRLREMLVRPRRRREEIEARLDLVEELVGKPSMRGDLAASLRRVTDIPRALARLSAQTASPRDLAALRDTLQELPSLLHTLSELESELGRGIVGRIHPLEGATARLSAAVADAPPPVLRDGSAIRPGFDAELDQLRALATGGKSFILSLEKKERERTGIPSLRVGFNRVFGYYLEVTNAHRHLVPADFIRRQTLVNAERYLTPELKEVEEGILSAEDRLLVREREIFEDLRVSVLGEAAALQETAASLADADAFRSLAEAAQAYGYSRPEILADDPGKMISIRGGRHPVVERVGPAEAFVPNDAYLDSLNGRLQVITGPNMAGKSTYMRQVALIVLMAQAGSFVPAQEAALTPVDRIFTRVGAVDFLTRGLSTFMVEMVETAEILHHATAESLILLDEIGRGTSTFDGISIAWAVAEHLLNGPSRGAKVLFATHYHELTELALASEGVRNLNVAVKEWGDRLVFLRRVQEGTADRSYGIQVARLAGLPPSIIGRAKEILANLGKTALDPAGRPVLAAHGEEGDGGAPPSTDPQMGLFAARQASLAAELRSLDIAAMTPIEALNYLAELVKRYG